MISTTYTLHTFARIWCVALVLAGLLAGCETAPGPGAEARPAGAGPPPPAIATRIPRPTPTPGGRGSARQNAPLSGLVRVDAGDDWFLPEVITVTVGTTVRWYHVGEEAHNATALDGSWSTNDFGIGAHAEYRFNKLGRFPYVCSLHAPGMSGIIVVVPK